VRLAHYEVLKIFSDKIFDLIRALQDLGAVKLAMLSFVDSRVQLTVKTGEGRDCTPYVKKRL